eukprot:m.94889 g.94889  ORF g.94889 m.94889 type:complete len:756 (-) comp12422_c1_seq1:60-2327(-)
MSHVFIKGGVWKNTEDEILKASVMKYGPNQWSRIASLLHRKSAAQCKRRWYEWLDPSIKKTEWSRDEEEKLLHLAKIMHSQWRTIAPMIGRTAIQCLEHYEKLLDKAQGESRSDDDPRRLRRGEIDPNTHARPARPDPIDMDEDEKEMLSEARARLANTQGKKAKRKARERQLVEAKRLARLQKRRELRAAGIGTRRRRNRRRGVDYNAEIPFEKKAPKGFFDPTSDDVPDLTNRRLNKRTDVEGKSKHVLLDKQKREDEKRIQDLKKKNLPAALMKINQLNRDEPRSKRSKLVLPKPQVTDEELESLVKLGQTGVEMLASVDDNAPTQSLLQNYNETPSIRREARTPIASGKQDTVMMEAQNILALHQTTNVLEGGENTPLQNSGGSFDGVTPVHEKMATPNRVFSTPFRGATVPLTPGRSGMTPVANAEASPLRDKLGINPEKDSSLLTPRTRMEKERQNDVLSSLRRGLSSLPTPKRDYEIVAPELPSDEPQSNNDGMERDAADVDDEELERRRLEAEKELKRQSLAIQRSLPLPAAVNEDVFTNRKEKDELQQIDEMIKGEMLSLLKQDKGLEKRGSRPSDSEMDAARALLKNETEAMMKEMHGDEEFNEIAGNHRGVWENMQDEVCYLVAKKRYGRASLSTVDDMVTTSEHEHKKVIEFMKKDLKRVAKLEKKLNIGLQGYQTRANAVRDEIAALGEEIGKAMMQKKAFEALRLNELNVIQTRKQEVAQNLNAQETRQSQLQQRYKSLVQ